MRKVWSFFLVSLLLFAGTNLFAQEEDESEYPDTDSPWGNFYTEPYTRGDKTFVISLGVLIPTVFFGIEGNHHGLGLGGTGSLAINYFVTPQVFFGGELGGMFARTRGGNMLFIIPFGIRAGYQLWFRRFELPVSLMIGLAPQRYLRDKEYVGPVIKPGASLYWRYKPEWSFGANANWWFVPQWPKNGQNTYGNFLELTLSARYHF